MARYACDDSSAALQGREITGYWEVPDLRPGITGYWQVNGRSNSTYDERVRLDTTYVRNWSLKLDLVLMAQTIRVLLSRRGAY